jgi:hypothetical protein
MTQARAIDRAIDVVLFAPLGAGLYVLEAAPNVVETFVARGRAEFDRRQEQVGRHVTTVRSTGQVALAFGLPKVRNRVTRVLARTPAPRVPARPARAPAAAPEPVAPVASQPVAPEHRSADPAPASWVPVSNGAAAAAELPIPGYDALSASQVVERLAGLVGSELDAVRSYEATHRNRRTILGKIEQLASPGA